MSTTTKIKVELYPRQWDFMATSDRLAAFVGGIGSGKTYVGAVRSLLFAIEQGGLGMVVAPTYPMLRDATLRTLIDIADLSLGIGLACFVALLLTQVWLELNMPSHQVWEALSEE